MNLTLAYAMGFSVASLPGPILFLIATETLRRGAWPGAQTALAPICIDAAVMLPLVMFVQLSFLSGHGAAAVLGSFGGLFLVWLGIRSMGMERVRLAGKGTSDKGTREMTPFLKGVLTHILNPYPYIFWGTVGLAFINEGFTNGGIPGALSFPLGFWLGASTFNFLVVYLVGRGKQWLPGRWEPYLHKASGTLLLAAGLFLVWSVWQNDHRLLTTDP